MHYSIVDCITSAQLGSGIMEMEGCADMGRSLSLVPHVSRSGE